MHRAEALFEWLVDGAPGAAGAPDVAQRLADGLCAAGVPLDRLGVFVTTLHPSVLGRAFRWSRGEPVKIGELTAAVRASSTFVESPVNVAAQTESELRLRIAAGEGLAQFAVARELAADGFSDYLCLPMRFVGGETQIVTFATKHPGGFTPAHVETLRDVVRPLARLAEILALRRTASNLLDTYVGHSSGERILAGRIFKGSIETLQAVIWLSDLRGFTELSARLPARGVIDTLNELFDGQVPAIEKAGGEVLKFMGDGLLAIFPFVSDGEAPERCAAALAAADAAFEAVAARNAMADSPIAFGLALHVGEVAYGNIGGASRLDFTAIGAAVNLAARLEGLTGKLGVPLVMSAAFAARTDRPLRELGCFELKGVPGSERVFALGSSEAEKLRSREAEKPRSREAERGEAERGEAERGEAERGEAERGEAEREEAEKRRSREGERLRG